MPLISQRTSTRNDLNRKLLVALTILYFIILIWIIVFKCNYNEGLHIETNRAMTIAERLEYKKIPFEKFISAVQGGGTLAVVEILAFIFNIVCFLPFGGFLKFFIEKKRTLIAIGVGFSLAIEVFQLFSCWGGPDLMDIVQNTLGVFLGTLIYELVRPRISDDKVNKIALVTTIVLIPFTVFIIINTILHFPG